MSRITLHVAHRQEMTATAVIDLRPGQAAEYRQEDRVVSQRIRLERPLPLSTLVRQVLTRYGLELATEGETDCMPRTADVIPGEPERKSLRA
jgi:hypothetical protein